MASKMDEIKTYTEREHQHSLAIVADLERMHNKIRSGHVDQDQLDFAVIRMVTAIENVLRRSVKTLVDSDLGCKLRGLSFLKGVKVSNNEFIDLWMAVEREECTTGDIVSKFAVPCSRFDHFFSILDAILGSNCKGVLIREFENDLRDLRPSMQEINEIADDLKELYISRHDLVHERQAENTTTPLKVDKWLSATITILQSLCFFIERQYGMECERFEHLFPRVKS